ncbi:hypothetical protein HUT19_19360 [Streptomyces sp. NA02950]|uniref:hypothetical protein n=1 Tax=Streptomyces sp. NA02950 TaxID=2742137 RepID=UPI001590CE64|nr:hypothetical protein [Streptomyces sp. NA02950]QKV93647.1 hypothetical protein HUT19_19360 [Streptomyces sp. NA02950]
MEQSTGPIIPPMHTAAGTDPGYIPGLTSPRPADGEEEPPKDTAERPPEDVLEEDAETDAEGEDATDDHADTDADADAEGAAEDEDGAGAAEDADADENDGDGPVFEASDHRGGIVARRTGVTLRMDGEEAQFDWDEIGAVEVDTPRFKKRFSVTVYATNRRWYEVEVQSSSRSLLKTWTEELDAVLDAYFDDAKPETEPDTTSETTSETTSKAEADEKAADDED